MVIIGGMITRVSKVITRKSNNEMAFVTIGDKTGTVDLVIFPKIFNLVKDFLRQDRVIIVEGKIDVREERMNLVVEKVEEIRA